MAALGPEQIQALFAQEASVRLDHLDQLLLQLEQTGDDETLIRSVFRELHTLKGSSAVAGLGEVSRRAHELEDIVEDLRAGRRVVTPDLIDTLLKGADQLGTLISQTLNAAEGETAQVDQGPDAQNGRVPPNSRSLLPNRTPSQSPGSRRTHRTGWTAAQHPPSQPPRSATACPVQHTTCLPQPLALSSWCRSSDWTRWSA